MVIRSLTDTYGNKFYYLGDLLHREDGPAAEYVCGANHYYYQGIRHRSNGPAIDDRYKVYYFHGKLHRLDGPAIEHPSGYKEWWVENNKIPVNSQIEFEKFLKLLAFI